jgi:hypothetical protein
MGCSTGGVIGAITYATPLGPSRSCITLGHAQVDWSNNVRSEQDVWEGGTSD